MNSKKNILITGGAGFIGSHLCKRLLNEGNKIICLDAKTGQENWNQPLIGSSDLVVCSDDGTRVLATSSVYEIELNDFIFLSVLPHLYLKIIQKELSRVFSHL